MNLEEKLIVQFVADFLQNELGENIELTMDSKLFGGDGPLDSMSLVNLIVDLEELIEDEYGLTINLADEKAMSRRTSPFSRVSSLVAYIQENLNEYSNE